MDLSGDRLFVIVDPRYGRVWALDRAGLARLIANTAGTLARRSVEEHGRLAEALKNAARLQRLGPDDFLLSLGCFWAGQYHAGFDQQVKSSKCCFVPVIYDLIPIDHPELCVAQTVRDFHAALPRTIRHASAFITISHYTKSRLEAFGVSTASPMPPIYVVPLAHQLSATPDPATQPDVSDTRQSGRFVLSVGTFEPRKNQLRLAEAWAMLTSDIMDMPTLVIVGKVGWLDPSSMARLIELARLSGKITLVHDISDHHLAALYRECLFTVFLSIDEGWGLPVGESLAFGKVCLASSAGAIPEAGDQFAVYVNPTDVNEIATALRSLIVDESYRHQLENDLRQGFQQRKWAEVAATILMAAIKIQDQFSHRVLETYGPVTQPAVAFEGPALRS